jgi:hypothetical protein
MPGLRACVRGKVLPIALVNKDVEDILHAKYADNRIVNEDYKLNGATEWFRPGGKFDEFIASVERSIPSLRHPAFFGARPS